MLIFIMISERQMDHPVESLGSRKVSSPEVLEAFHRDHNVETGTNKWALGLVEIADREFEGNWSEVKLSREQILRIMLPHHGGERGLTELIPPEGMTVEQAVARLKQLDDYPESNPGCWSKISHSKNTGFSPVFLSASPVDHEDYPTMVVPDNNFVHLDGLHRLLAWGLDGRYDLDSDSANETLTAYIAGYE
jgi:uncharacterized protein DUF6309